MAAEFKESRITERVSIDLSDEKKEELNHWIDSNKEAMSKDRDMFLDRQKKYLFQWDDFITFTRKGPWDDSANLHMPLTSIMVKTYHSRLYNIFTQENVTQFTQREDSDEKQIEILKKLRSWYLYDHINEYRGLKGVTYEVIYDLVTVGYSTLFKGWDVKQRKMLDLVEVEEFNKELADFIPNTEEAIRRGEKSSVKNYKEVEKIITHFEGTSLKSISFEDIYFPNDIPESSNLDHPPCVVVCTEMTVSDLKLGAKQKKWSEEDADKVIDETYSRVKPASREQDIKQARDVLTGYDSQNSNYDHETREIEYVFCTRDIDDDGIAEEFVVTRSSKGTILNIVHLDRVSRTGRRPLFKFDCFAKSRQAYSRGVPEFVYALQEEMDMQHNMRMDYLQLQTCPFGVYRAGSSLDNQQIRIAPGKYIPVDEVTDLKTINFNVNATVFSGEEDRLWRYAEQQLAVSPLSSGSVPGVVGPTRSTSGVVTLLQQMEKQLRPVVEQLAIQWKKLEQALLEDLDYKVDPEIKMRVLGPALKEQFSDEEIKRINRSILLTQNFDLKIDVASVVSSDEIKVNNTSVILQAIVNPTIAHQLGIIGPKAIYKAYYEYLKAYKQDPDQYLEEPDLMSGKPLTLWQEIQICVQGEIPPMSMKDDHEQKAQLLAAFTESSEFLEAMEKGIYEEDSRHWFDKAIKKHLSLAEALRPKGLPNPTGEQGIDINQQLSGTSDQQGGDNVENTTSRDTARPAPNEAGAGPSEAVQQ